MRVHEREVAFLWHRNHRWSFQIHRNRKDGMFLEDYNSSGSIRTFQKFHEQYNGCESALNSGYRDRIPKGIHVIFTIILPNICFRQPVCVNIFLYLYLFYFLFLSYQLKNLYIIVLFHTIMHRNLEKEK